MNKILCLFEHVLSHFLTIKECYNFSKAFPILNFQNIMSKKFYLTIKKILKDDADYIFKILKERRGVLSGSIMIRAAHDIYDSPLYEYSDVDIFVHKDENDTYVTDMNYAYNINVCKIVEMYTKNNIRIQIITIDSDKKIIDYINESFDFSFCKNTMVINNEKPEIKIYNWDDLLEKKTNFDVRQYIDYISKQRKDFDSKLHMPRILNCLFARYDKYILRDFTIDIVNDKKKSGSTRILYYDLYTWMKCDKYCHFNIFQILHDHECKCINKCYYEHNIWFYY